jgi:hypothetical protein
MSEVRVLPTSLVVGGWRGELTISGDVLTVVSEDGSKKVSIDAKELKRGAFNSNNGLWIFHLKNGKKVRLQSAGVLLSADRSDAGRQANTDIRALMQKHKVKGIRL